MNTELLCPAGSFDAGYYALQNGADALYLGLPAFSARKAAKNFSMDDFARIKALAESEGKRVYAAVNTLLTDEEIPAVLEILCDLEALNVDGLIIQDFALLEIIKKHFKKIPVHASTQMGIHNAQGAKFLAGEGVDRIILSRELTLEEIAFIRKECPEIELEVFIHGALCYSFSGLCLASGMLTGRSGNRGECAQLCRNWYAARGKDGTEEKRYCFSRNDLCLGGYVLRLQDMGIRALKIEGRMKSAAWVAAVTAYYRAVLDGKSKEEQETLLEKSRVIFSRKAGTGFLEGENRETINAFYPGHTGVPAGTAETPSGSPEKGFILRLQTDLAVRDGLLYFSEDGEPRPFAVAQLYRNGKKTSFALAGQTVFAPGPEIPAGAEVRKISSHNSRLPEVNRKLPRKRISLNIRLKLLPQELEFFALSPAGLFPLFRAVFPVQPQAAKTSRRFADIAERYLAPPEDSRFETARLEFENSSPLADDAIYINPGILKSLRRQAYARLEEHYSQARKAKIAGISEAEPSTAEKNANNSAFPPRSAIGENSLRETSWLPFVTNPETLKKEKLYTDESGRTYIPLAPVLFAAGAYLDGIAEFVRRALKQDTAARYALGLCNAGHFALAETFAAESRVEFFIDYGLYCANRQAAAFFASRLPRLLFCLPWIENPQTQTAYGNFKPPLFTGRSFQEKEERGIRQGKNRFIIKTLRIAGAWLELVFAI